MEKRRGRITLRGGTSIDVLLFADAHAIRDEVASGPGAGGPEAAHRSAEPPPPSAPASGAPAGTRPPLHVCTRCASDLVYPTGWEEHGQEHWSIDLRCPACEHRATGIFPQSLADHFDQELDRATEALLADLRRLTHANMVEDVERLVAALEADAILPMDF